MWRVSPKLANGSLLYHDDYEEDDDDDEDDKKDDEDDDKEDDEARCAGFHPNLQTGFSCIMMVMRMRRKMIK